MSAIRSSEIHWYDGVVWQFESSLRDELLAPDGISIERWVGSGKAERIKSAPGRDIHRLELAGGPAYLKRFWPKNAWHALRHRLGLRRAEAEFMLAQEFARLDIPTVRPMAVGVEGKRPLRSYFLSEAVPRSRPVYEFVEENFRRGILDIPTRVRRQAIRDLAEIIARLHQAGMEHRDLHERNILVQSLGRGKSRFVLLDLQDVRKHRWLSWRSARRDLSRLGRYFSIRVTRTDRLAFFQHYARHRDWDGAVVRKRARDAERETIESRARFWRRRDRRWSPCPTGFTRVRQGGVRVRASQDVTRDLIERALERPNDILTREVKAWIKSTNRRGIAVVCLDRSLPTQIVKQERKGWWKELWASWFREPVGSRCWRLAHSLRLREIPTPKAQMLVEQRRLGIVAQSMLCMDQSEGARSAIEYIDMIAREEGETRSRRRSALAQLARLIRMMHDRRVTHRDLKASNILAREEEGLPAFTLIDLEGARTWQNVPWSRRVQNLSRLAVSLAQSPHLKASDLAYMLRVYLGREWSNESERRRWIVATCARMMQKRRRNRRRGRAVT